ncbi:hypothetical protein [Paenibacillus sp. 481]|uniref:hypothetical protein n=1 Tax=Paenibacillus sp. 481 TaxID=2835869 RepID=UPI001E450AA1|nr:hypothetical protein [Paenibacillus sp. 481]UHA72146.1 hypothetical protein KIK04_15730 [Paenibacillus sp. 481]
MKRANLSDIRFARCSWWGGIRPSTGWTSCMDNDVAGLGYRLKVSETSGISGVVKKVSLTDSC